jgi:hypothetical protein
LTLQINFFTVGKWFFFLLFKDIWLDWNTVYLEGGHTNKNNFTRILDHRHVIIGGVGWDLSR